MNETTDTTEAVQDTAAAVDDAAEHDAATTTEAQQDSSSDDTDAGEDRHDNANVEAAKYRKRAQAAEAERDSLAERLTRLQRAEAERLAGQRLGKGADLWAGGIELGSLLDDGELSTDLLEQAVTEVLAQHPHWRTHSAPPASTVTADGKIGSGDTRTSFVDAFRPRSD